MPTAEDLARRLRAAGSVFAEDEARLLLSSGEDGAALEKMIGRRLSGDPLEYILGWVEFCGLRVAVEEGVFVPRQRTALLVERAVAGLRPGATVVDLCCGCGAIGLAIATMSPGVRLFAADIDPRAVACARRNLEEIGVVVEGDLFAALPDRLRGTVEVIAANVPYVPTEAIALMPPEAREHEPQRTLDGGDDGLDVARRVAREAAAWLAPGGRLLIEVGEEQVEAAVTAFREGGLAPEVVEDEEIGATVIAGVRMDREA